jgi:spore maturation protein CgeB
MKKILIAGSMNNAEVYEKPLINGFKKNYCLVKGFKIYDKFPINFFTFHRYILHTRLRCSYFLQKKNNQLIDELNTFKPNILILWRTTTILPETISIIKNKYPSIKILIYHNDNPYSGLLNRFKYRHYLNSICLADISVVYRPSDFNDIKKFKPKKVKLLKPNYISYLHKPKNIKKSIDVVFIGHFTTDREKILDDLYEKKILFEVYGPGWFKLKNKKKWSQNIKLKNLYGKEYANKISQSKIAIGLLSTKNKDVYTRRCFEITACKTMLIAPKTKELKKIYKENYEAVFWNHKNQIASKIIKYLQDLKNVNKITNAGHKRVKKDLHSEVSRAKEILSWF